MKARPKTDFRQVLEEEEGAIAGAISGDTAVLRNEPLNESLRKRTNKQTIELSNNGSNERLNEHVIERMHD